MRFYLFFLGIISILLLSQCKKETQTISCLDETQRNQLVHSLEKLSHDTIQFSSAERQFLNEIRSIANDMDILSASIDTTISIQESYNQIRANFLQHADVVAQKASTFYDGSPAKIVLAKNAFVLMSYDALQRTYPEFMWTQLGIFAANEVRNGLVLALMLRQTLINNNIQIPFNNTDLTNVLLETSEILIQGQIDVLTDIGSLGILNKKMGAAAIKNEPWLTSEAKEGFRLQELAEYALNINECNSFMDLQTQAAIQFGAHEQIYILQPMWNQPVMQQFADMNQLITQLTQHQLVFFGDIFIGTNKTTESDKGYTIKIPSNVSDLSNAQQRVAVAMNGFNSLNSLRKNNHSKYWIDYSQIKIAYFYDVYNVPWID